jgi:S-adenosylmethionine decarboxylase
MSDAKNMTPDHFITDSRGTRAGTHVIADFWHAHNLDNVDEVRHTLILAAEATGATILTDNFHSFGEGEGCTGVVVLAESHISIHTWPEREYAAVDIFTCGLCDPHAALPVMRERFQSEHAMVQEILRGVVL